MSDEPQGIVKVIRNGGVCEHKALFKQTCYLCGNGQIPFKSSQRYGRTPIPYAELGDWAISFLEQTGKYRNGQRGSDSKRQLTTHIVVSFPEATPHDRAEETAEWWAEDVFGDNLPLNAGDKLTFQHNGKFEVRPIYDYATAFHTNRPHPHMHLVVNRQSFPDEEGKTEWLKISNRDDHHNFECMRESLAYGAYLKGIRLGATSREERGLPQPVAYDEHLRWVRHNEEWIRSHMQELRERLAHTAYVKGIRLDGAVGEEQELPQPVTQDQHLRWVRKNEEWLRKNLETIIIIEEDLDVKAEQEDQRSQTSAGAPTDQADAAGSVDGANLEPPNGQPATGRARDGRREGESVPDSVKDANGLEVGDSDGVGSAMPTEGPGKKRRRSDEVTSDPSAKRARAGTNAPSGLPWELRKSMIEQRSGALNQDDMPSKTTAAIGGASGNGNVEQPADRPQRKRHRNDEEPARQRREKRLRTDNGNLARASEIPSTVPGNSQESTIAERSTFNSGASKGARVRRARANSKALAEANLENGKAITGGIDIAFQPQSPNFSAEPVSRNSGHIEGNQEVLPNQHENPRTAHRSSAVKRRNDHDSSR